MKFDLEIISWFIEIVCAEHKLLTIIEFQQNVWELFHFKLIETLANFNSIPSIIFSYFIKLALIRFIAAIYNSVE